MISERRFSTTFTAFWNQALPRGDAFLRRINGTYSQYRTEIDSPSNVDGDRRSIVNELGFRLFREGWKKQDITTQLVHNLYKNVQQYIAAIARREDKLIFSPPSAQEIKESKEIAESLSLFFSRSKGTPLLFWPEFPGCGIIQQCKGDMLYGNTLVEVKSGDRTFRITDLRQVLTYCCLNFASRKYDLRFVTLLNPRRGVFYEAPIDELVTACAGVRAIDLFTDMVTFISMERNSK
jgi:hypothetical protein